MASGSPHSVSRAEVSGGEVPPNEADGEADIENPELAAALSLLCDFARDEMSNRTNPSPVRLERVEARFDATPQEALLDRFFDAVERHAMSEGEESFPTFHSVAAAAEANGVPGYRCEPFQRLLALVRADDPDLALGQARSPLQELGVICDVAQEAESWDVAEAELSYQFARRIDSELTHPELRHVFDGLGNAAPAERYQRFQMGVAELGAVGWTCPALARVLSP